MRFTSRFQSQILFIVGGLTSTKQLPKKIPGRNVNIRETVDFSPENLIEKYELGLNGLLHIGANSGDSIGLYSLVAPRPVLAIEPLAQPFELLKNAVSTLPNVSTLNVAIAPEADRLGMYVANNGGQSSSLLRPARHLDFAQSVSFESIEIVDSVPLESVEIDADLDFWLIDTQGTELDVLRSAGAKVNNAKFIYCEVNRGETYENCTRIRDLDHYLHSVGFRRVLTRWFALWGDALYVREREHSHEID